MDNTCICCGRIIPEGRFICLHCEGQNEMQKFRKKPKTNGDRIRRMTDDELADVLQGQCACCAYRLTGCTEKECKGGVLEWLKQEVSEDAGTD